MKNLTKAILIVLVLVFSGCATVDRGNFPQLKFGELSASYKNSYDVIDTSKEDIGIPKPPVPVVERFEVVDGGCSGKDCGTYYSNFAGTSAGSGGDRERLELKNGPHTRDTYVGDEYWYTWSIYFPKDYKSIAPAQVTYGQFHSKTEVLYMFVEKGHGYQLKKPMVWDGLYAPLIKKEDLRGKWHTIKLHVKWDTDPKKGFFKVWVDGKLKYEEHEKNYYGDMPYFKYGIYRCYLSRYRNSKRWEYYDKLAPDASKSEYDKVTNMDITTPTQVVYYSNVKRSNTEEGLNLSW